jgi:hypothetical protein
MYYEKREAFVLENDNSTKLDENINAIGKSKQGNVFAIFTIGHQFEGIIAFYGGYFLV